MADQIELAKFDFNVDEVVKSASVIKKQIEEIKESQKVLKKFGQESSAAFIENEADLKALNKEYNNHIKVIQEATEKTAQQANRTELLEFVLNQEVTTIKEAREQNKLLNQLRNDTNFLTEQGAAELNLLNDKLDENNKLVKDNVDAYTKQKINIGNYKDSIKEAFDEMNIFNGGLVNMQQNILVIAEKSKEAGGGFAFFRDGAKAAGQGMVQLTKATLGFLLTPIGAVLGVLVGAFLLIKNALDRNEESMDKLKKAFAPFTGIINGLLKALEPLGEFLIDGIAKGLEFVEKAIFKAMKGIATALEFLGFDEAAANLRNFTNEIEESARVSKELADAEARLRDEQRKSETIQKQYMKRAEDLRQIRDDENLTIKERIRANEELGAVLQQQLQDELRIAQSALEVANLRIKLEGQTKEALDGQAEALAQIADIEERINGQASEQLTNRVALEKEAQAQYEEAIDKRLEKHQQEIDLFIAQQGERARTLQEELDLEREVSDQRLALLQEELDHKRISQEEYATEVLNIKNELARKEAEIEVANAEREVAMLKESIARKREENQFLTQALADERKAENDAILQEQMQLAQTRLEQGVINQNEYDQAIREVQEENRLANKEIDDERIAVEKEEAIELRAIEFEEEMERLREEKASQFEIEQAIADEQRAIEEQKLLDERNKGLISEELYQARLGQIDAKYKKAEKKREEILAKQKLQLVAGSLNAVAQVVDENSAAGKAIALAQAGINTYEGISAGVALGWPMAIPAVAFAAITGFKSISDILKTKVPSATGKGDVGGGGSAPQKPSGLSSGLSGITGQGVNLTQVAGSGNAAVQNQIEQDSQLGNIAEDVGDAVREGSAQGTAQGSEEGMTNLSNNRRIQEQSSF